MTSAGPPAFGMLLRQWRRAASLPTRGAFYPIRLRQSKTIEAIRDCCCCGYPGRPAPAIIERRRRAVQYLWLSRSLDRMVGGTRLLAVSNFRANPASVTSPRTGRC